jgi:hypothetical protein
MATIGKFNNSTRPGERQAFSQRPLLPPVRKRTVASIARANNEKLKGPSPTELAREARTHRNPKAELRALAGRPLGENSGESMNKETYKEYVRQRLHEEYYNRYEKKAMRKAATAQLATDAAVRMGIRTPRVAGMERDEMSDMAISPKFKNNLAIMFHNIEQRHHSEKHQEDKPAEEPLPIIAFDKLSKKQKMRHHNQVEAAIETLNEHQDIDTGHNEGGNFEKMFSHYRSLLGRPQGDGYSEHEEMIDRHKLVHTMKMLKPDLPDLED